MGHTDNIDRFKIGDMPFPELFEKVLDEPEFYEGKKYYIGVDFKGCAWLLTRRLTQIWGGGVAVRAYKWKIVFGPVARNEQMRDPSIDQFIYIASPYATHMTSKYK